MRTHQNMIIVGVNAYRTNFIARSVNSDRACGCYCVCNKFRGVLECSNAVYLIWPDIIRNVLFPFVFGLRKAEGEMLLRERNSLPFGYTFLAQYGPHRTHTGYGNDVLASKSMHMTCLPLALVHCQYIIRTGRSTHPENHIFR